MAINIKQIIKEELVHHKLDEHFKRTHVNEGEVNEYGGAEVSKSHALKNIILIKLESFEKLLSPKHKKEYKKALKPFWEVFSELTSKIEIGESVNEAVKPIKLSGNLKKDLKAVTDIAGKMVKYAKDNFNTYIPTGEKLSQLKLGGTTEKDVLKYNINHLAKAINKDLKKKYMKDFMAESVNKSINEMQVINKKTGKDVTKHMLAYMEGKITKEKFEKLTGLSKEKIKVSEDAKYLQVAELLKQANEGTLDISEENAAILREKLVFYVDKKGKKRRFDTDASANKKYSKS